MTARILHVADLHIGRRDAEEPFAALRELATRLSPTLVVATGDLAHRGRPSELERAAERLRELDLPLLAVPGNHDIPYSVPARFMSPFAAWERIVGPAEPEFADADLFVVGLNSVRPWRQQGGALSKAALTRASERVRAAPDGALRVVALHHHLAAPPWRAARKRPLRRRGEVLRTLVEAGVDLVLGGHVHQAAVAVVPEFQAGGEAGLGSLVLATAPGFGRPRPHRQGEAQGLNVYDATADTMTITTFARNRDTFAQVGQRAFRRG
ncbi:MAG TPA: metallophosphoesterase [Gaiellaceae bacterium]|nr:metallophosphoesterase [Gaiellaceae bacterium]